MQETGMDVRTESNARIQVARILHGPNAEAGPCFEQLLRWVSTVGVPTGRLFTLSWNHRVRAPADRLRSEARVKARTAEVQQVDIEPAGGGCGQSADYRLDGRFREFKGR